MSALGRRQLLAMALALAMWPAALFLELALLMREKFIGPENPAVTKTIDDLKPLEATERLGSVWAPIEPHDE